MLVSISPLGAVPLCINNVIATSLQREAISLVWGAGYLPRMWEKKECFWNYRAKSFGIVVLLRIPSRAPSQVCKITDLWTLTNHAVKYGQPFCNAICWFRPSKPMPDDSAGSKAQSRARLPSSPFSEILGTSFLTGSHYPELLFLPPENINVLCLVACSC